MKLKVHANSRLLLYWAGQVLLRDPFDENVTPVVEELRRRLKPSIANQEDQGEGKDSTAQQDVDAAEEDGIPCTLVNLDYSL